MKNGPQLSRPPNPRMTAGKLIEELQRHDANFEVVISCEHDRKFAHPLAAITSFNADRRHSKIRLHPGS